MWILAKNMLFITWLRIHRYIIWPLNLLLDRTLDWSPYIFKRCPLYMQFLVHGWGLRPEAKMSPFLPYPFFQACLKTFCMKLYVCFKLTVASECCCCICSILQTCRMADLGFKIFCVQRIRRVREALSTISDDYIKGNLFNIMTL